jgi:hypothetical protein
VNLRAARTIGLVATTLATTVACGPSAAYDNLTGGARAEAEPPQASHEVREDPALAAPRPPSPVSVSLVATLRPRLRWALAVGESGAVVEMSRTRGFERGAAHRFEAEGAELVVPEDLEPGVWFWRLVGRAPGRVGTKPSPTWEVVVRGPAANGSSDAPSGSMLDLDGDGEADLVTVADVKTATFTGPELIVYLGNAEHRLVDSRTGYLVIDGAVDGFVSVAGGTDLDGDGLADFVTSGLFAGTLGERTEYPITVDFGGPEGIDDAKTNEIALLSRPTTPVFVSAAGDANGDGWGDVVVALDEAGVVAFGGPNGMQATSAPLYQRAGETTARVALGGFDANGDGLSDLAFSFESAVPGAALAGEAMLRVDRRTPLVAAGPSPSAGGARAFASGDFDGDGLADLAMTVPDGESSAVCVWLGDRGALLRFQTCVMPLAGERELGASLAAGDIDEDGKDDLLASVVDAAGTLHVEVLHIDGKMVMTESIAELGVGARLSTLWPGRPGKARWAATSADMTSIAIFEGTTKIQTLGDPLRPRLAFGKALR